MSVKVSEWKKALMSIYDPDVIPKGWKTCKQIKKEIGKGESYTCKLLGRLVKAGKCEVKKFKVQTHRGIFPIVHYKLKGGQHASR